MKVDEFAELSVLKSPRGRESMTTSPYSIIRCIGGITHQTPAGRTITTPDIWVDEQNRFHNENDLPAVVYPGGTKQWYRHGVHHRGDSLPARVGSNGERAWVVDGKKHNENGPAYTRPGGVQEYWTQGVRMDVIDAVSGSDNE